MKDSLCGPLSRNVFLTGSMVKKQKQKIAAKMSSSTSAIADDVKTATPELYVVLSNKSSKQNLGTYLRTASAFGATQVIVGRLFLLLPR